MVKGVRVGGRTVETRKIGSQDLCSRGEGFQGRGGGLSGWGKAFPFNNITSLEAVDDMLKSQQYCLQVM